MSIDIRFACGHPLQLSSVEAGKDAPVCAVCGEHRVARVSAPKPSFRGSCQGPLASSANLPGLAINAAPGGPLVLKGNDS